MSEAVHAFGTKLQVETNTDTYTDVAQLTDISGPNVSVDEIDISSHDSDDTYREFVAGMRDGGEVSFEGNFLNTHDTLEAAGDILDLLHGGNVESWKIVFPDDDDTEWAFDGFVTAFETTGNFEDKATFTATIKVSGKPTLT